MAKAGKSGRKRLAEGITFGRYVLLEELGAGGMGVVYAALDPDLNRRVALKLIRGDRVESGRAESDSARLLREARAMAKLHHPNVVTVHDVGTIDGRVFVAMEYVEGSTLKQWLAQGPHPHPRVLDVMTRAAEGLVAAHEAGIIHRDFKPDNVLLGDDDTVKVLDFGLARPPDTGRAPGRDDDGERPKEFRTRVGVVLGTPLYMSPEQHRGRALDERSDQFSYCAVLYEALYGQRPFSGRNRQAVAMQACNGHVEKIPADSQVPAYVRAAVARGMLPDPAERWPSMRALLDALADDPVEARKRMGLAAGAVGLGVIGVVALAWPRAAEDPCPPEVEAAAASWDETRVEGWRERVASADASWSQTSAETTANLVHAWFEGWRTERTESCEATRVRHDQSEERGRLRAQCLDHQLAAAATVLDRVEPVHAAEAAAHLPDPTRCREDAQLSAVEAAPDGGDLLREAAVLTALPPGDDALAQAKALVDAATERQDAPGRARAELALARQRAASSQTDPATASAQTAAQTAVGLGDAELAARAWIAQAGLDRDAGRVDLARRWLSYADAELHRLSHPDHLRADLDAAWARTLSAAHEHDRAIDRATAALDAWREAVGPEHLRVAQAMDLLADVLEAAGRKRDAKPAREEARRLREAALGEGHPALTR